jgi:hypothetical protein
MNIDQRIAQLEALLFHSTIPGTQISRVLNSDSPGLGWCVAIGAMQMPKLFFYGNTVEDALTAAEQQLLTPKVPDARMLRAMARNPSAPIFQGPGIRAVLNMDGIDLAAYRPKPRRAAAAA